MRFLSIILTMAAGLCLGTVAQGQEQKSIPIFAPHADVPYERIEELIKLIGDKDYKTRETAYKELGEIGFKAIPPMIVARSKGDVSLEQDKRMAIIIEKYLSSVGSSDPSEPYPCIYRLCGPLHFEPNQNYDNDSIWQWLEPFHPARHADFDLYPLRNNLSGNRKLYKGPTQFTGYLCHYYYWHAMIQRYEKEEPGAVQQLINGFGWDQNASRDATRLLARDLLSVGLSKEYVRALLDEMRFRSSAWPFQMTAWPAWMRLPGKK